MPPNPTPPHAGSLADAADCRADTGPTDPQSTKGWGVIDFDWSNWKGTGSSDGWAKQQPMDCEERLATQVQMTTAASPSTKVVLASRPTDALRCTVPRPS